MAWFDKTKEESRYLSIAKILEERQGRCGEITTNYSMRYEGKIPHAKVDIVLRKMLERIDDESFVTLREIKEVPNPYGNHAIIFGTPRKIYKGFYFYILKDDIPKIETDEPIHIVCEADEFPSSKEKFLDIVKLFM